MRWSGTIGLLTAGGVALLGGLIARVVFVNKTEEPPFRLEATHDGLEIRVYEAQVVAETVVEGDLRPGLNEGFRRLAGYIFGGNAQRQKIAMTAPVGAQGEKIAMTAPVGAQAEGGGRFRVSFVMPAGRTLESLPVPNDDRVTLRTVPARRVAALRFSGRASEVIAGEKQREARALVEQHALHAVGEPVLAQYNPPWTLPFLRRNEILIDLCE